MDNKDYVLIPEKAKRPGVYYAVTPDGIEIPVIDISNPAFVGRVSQTELAEIEAASLKSWKKARFAPKFLERMLARRSILMRGTLEAAGGYVSGMASYYQKLGPELLGHGYARRLDYKLANFIGPVCMRLRLATMAQTLARCLQATIHSHAGPIFLINVGGGPAADSINALILTRRDHPDLLSDRQIKIRVLDADTAGPEFGRRCLATLSASGAPLHGLDLDYQHFQYSWSDPRPFKSWLREWQADKCGVVISSEGGLFEYGSNDEIKGIMQALNEAASDDCLMVGSVYRDGNLNHEIKKLGKLTIQPRSEESFAELMESTGWTVDFVEDQNPLSGVVTLGRRGNKTWFM